MEIDLTFLVPAYSGCPAWKEASKLVSSAGTRLIVRDGVFSDDWLVQISAELDCYRILKSEWAFDRVKAKFHYASWFEAGSCQIPLH